MKQTSLLKIFAAVGTLTLANCGMDSYQPSHRSFPVDKYGDRIHDLEYDSNGNLKGYNKIEDGRKIPYVRHDNGFLPLGLAQIENLKLMSLFLPWGRVGRAAGAARVSRARGYGAARTYKVQENAAHVLDSGF